LLPYSCCRYFWKEKYQVLFFQAYPRDVGRDIGFSKETLLDPGFDPACFSFSPEGLRDAGFDPTFSFSLSTEGLLDPGFEEGLTREARRDAGADPAGTMLGLRETGRDPVYESEARRLALSLRASESCWAKGDVLRMVGPFQ
jgi:hypothetical protein